jgi:hypothetical protein
MFWIVVFSSESLSILCKIAEKLSRRAGLRNLST